MHTKFGHWLAQLAASLTANPTIQSRYKPFHLFFKAIGLNSFTFDGKHEPAFSKLGAVYSLILSVGYMSFHSYAVGLFPGEVSMTAGPNTSNGLVRIIDVYSTYSGLATIVSIIVNATLQQQNLVRAIGLLFEVDRLFANRLVTTVDNTKWQVRMFGYLVVCLIGVVTLEFLDCIMFISMYIFKTVTNCYTICIVQLLFYVVAENHFIGHLLLVHDRYAMINGKLEHFCGSGDQQRIEDLLVMITIYKKVEECHKVIDAAFGLLNCAIIMIRSILMATLSYELVLKLINFDFNTNYHYQVVHIAYCFFWTVWMLGELFFLFYVGHITETEAARTRAVLHFSLTVGDEQMDHLIGNFINKLKTNVKTSPFGLFTLNMTSFFALIAGAVSYLMVLVQLDSKSL